MADKENVVPGNVARFAASSVGSGGTVWTAHLVFSSTLSAGATALDQPELIVSLPWPLAKALVEVLRSTVEQYEKIEGEIALPKSYVEKRDALPQAQPDKPND